MGTLLERALVLATVAHDGQMRKYTNEPYITHPVSVMKILKMIGKIENEEAQAAAVLHDVIEDCNVTAKQIELVCNLETANLVLEVTDVSKKTDGNRKVRKDLDRDHLAKSSYLGASIKLADMIDNSFSICVHDKDFATVYMQEKKDILKILKHGNNTLWIMADDLVRKYYDSLGRVVVTSDGFLSVRTP